MTADDARRLVRKVTAPDAELVLAVRACWDKAIERAANAGEWSVSEFEVDRLRCPIPAAVYEAVYAGLKADGYEVSYDRGPRNETGTVVSWRPPIVLPKSSSGTTPPRHRG